MIDLIENHTYIYRNRGKRNRNFDTLPENIYLKTKKEWISRRKMVVLEKLNKFSFPLDSLPSNKINYPPIIYVSN